MDATDAEVLRKGPLAHSMSRRMRAFAGAAAFTLLSGAFPARADGASGDLAWSSNLGEVLRKAANAGKPVLVDVWAVWCVPCKQMDETTYRDPIVKAESDNFVLLKVDADVQIPFIERYRIEAFPTVLFLDEKGSEIARFRGYRSASELAPKLKAVREGFEAYRKARETRGNLEFMGDYLLTAGNPAGAAERYLKAAKEMASDPGKRDACEMKLAAAEADAGRPKSAISVYDRLSRTAVESTRRADALVAMIKTQYASGKRKDALAALGRLATEFPDRVPDVDPMVK